MATQIIDGFQVNSNVPIDNRIVASGSTARNAIPYKYHGLRVFDISNNVPYVWNGTAWINENSSSITGTGTTNFFPIFSAPGSVQDSFLYQDSGVIKTGDDGGGDGLVQISPYYGSVTAYSFIGDGYNVTNLLGSNINNGSIPVDGSLPAGSKIIKGSTGQVLVSGTSFTFWQNQNQLSVGTSSVALIANTASSVTVTNNSTNATNYLTFVSSTGSPSVRINTDGISYNPNTKLLRTNGGDINLSSSVSSNGYVIMGTRIYENFGLGYSSINPTIATVNIPSESTITVEVTFTGKILEFSGSSFGSIIGRNNRSTKYIAAYRTSPTGSITQLGSTNTVLNVAAAGTGTTILSAGTIDTSTNNQLKFVQSVVGSYTPPGSGFSINSANVYLTVDYKITIS